MMVDEEFAREFRAALGRLATKERLDYSVTIESGFLGLPRASSIGSCARQQLYLLRCEPQTDAPDPTSSWPAWLGNAGQVIVAGVLREMGYTVEEGIDINIGGVLSGHLDGELSGLDLDETYVWDCKLRNVYGFLEMLSNGPDLVTYLQMQAYMHARGRNRALITVLPFDLSIWRTELRRRKLDDIVVHRIVVEANTEAQELIFKRAEALVTANTLGTLVHREFSPVSMPDARFPCGYCPWRTRCVIDDLDEEALAVPAVPSDWRSRWIGT